MGRWQWGLGVWGGCVLAAVMGLSALRAGATEPFAWEVGSTAWRTQHGWVWPDPWLERLGAALVEQAVAEDGATWTTLRPAVSEHLQTLTAGPFPQPLAGTRTWAAGAVNIAFSHAWDPAFWGGLPAGAVSPAAVMVTLQVSGRVPRPTGWLAVEALAVETGAVTPTQWGGAGPAEVIVSLSLPPGGNLVAATRSDGGAVSVTPTPAGATLRVALAAGAATVLQVRWRRPTSAWRLRLGTTNALTWEVRGPPGVVWLDSPATAVDGAGEGEATLWATGWAGVAHAVATVGMPAVEFTEEVREVLLAASGPGGVPAAVLTATPASGRDPLGLGLRWLTAGATAVALIDPAGTRLTVATAGGRPAKARYRWTGVRDQPSLEVYRLEATGPGGMATATAPVWVEPTPASLSVDGPSGPLSIGEQKAGGG